MKGFWLAAGCLAVTGCSDPRLASKEETSKPGLDVQFEVPQDGQAQVVHVLTRDIPAGGEIPWHTHPGIEIGYVESGEVEFSSAGAEPRRLGPGESFSAPRGVVHGGSNPTERPARIVITYVVDRDAPLRTPADPPESD